MVTLQNSYDYQESTTRGLESQIAKKNVALTKEQAWAADIENWLAQNEELLWLANVKAQATEDWARATKERARATKIRDASISIQTMGYKDSDNFVNDAIEAGKDAYFIGFIDCKDIVAQAYRTLDLSSILASGEEESTVKGEEEEAGERDVEKANADKVIKVPGSKTAMIEAPKEVAATP